MTLLAVTAALFCIVATLLHLTTTALVIIRQRRRLPASDILSGNSAVTLIRPVCGLDDIEKQTLATSFTLDHANLELLFCAARAEDAAVPYIRELIARHPQVNARLLLGNADVTPNPKLNNMIKGWHAASHELIVMADSNLLLPKDYIAQLLGRWRHDTGLVCAPPIAGAPQNFWAEVECAFLNTYQARWQYAADSIGFGFAQGKTMLWRRADLDRAGGILALGAEVAEDAAATKIVRNNGLNVRLAGPSFVQPAGSRTASNVFGRQVRWAQLRRLSFPVWFAPEVFTGCLLPMIAAAIAASGAGLSPTAAVAGVAVLWLGAEAALARVCDWPLSLISPAAWIMRDALIPIVWAKGWLKTGYTWRGNHIDLTAPVGQA